MNYFERQFGWLEPRFRSKFDAVADWTQSAFDWVINNPGIIIPTLALFFLVSILYIAARNVIMPEDREESG